MKKLSSFLLCYALIPFIASLPGFVLNLGGLSTINIAAVPVLTAAIYVLLKRSVQWKVSSSCWLSTTTRKKQN